MYLGSKSARAEQDRIMHQSEKGRKAVHKTDEVVHKYNWTNLPYRSRRASSAAAQYQMASDQITAAIER